MRQIHRQLLTLVTLGLVIFATIPTAFAGSPACDKRNNNTVKKLTECVTVDGVREHQAAFQAIADANGGTRDSGSPGYDQSVDYVGARLLEAGYNVTVQSFDHTVFYQVGPSTLEQTAPGLVTYLEGADYLPMTETEPGDVTAPVTAVDLDLGLGNASTSGCEGADFAGFPAGNIALLQRGACSFQLKAENAAAAGAVGAIIFNQGNTPDRTGVINGTLGTLYSGGIPVVFASYDRGEDWALTPGLTLHMFVNVFRGVVTDYNVLAESTNGDPGNVIMVGANLDSNDAGPGINNNGSGSAAILEVALKMAKVKPRNMVRFAWWGGSASGLLGSTEYVNTLSQDELDDIALYLDFAMIGSPNFVRFIYDGDGSEFGLVGPAGSDSIEAFFEGFYASRGLASEATEISGTSDYVAFFLAEIPIGGLFAGAEGIKTADQAAVFGGTAGEQYDPCFQLACDTFDNVSLEVLDVNADAIANAVLYYARTGTP